MGNYRYIIKNITRPTADVIVLELADLLNRPVFDFTPGQYVMISYIDKKGAVKDKHAFSLASSPTSKDIIRLGIKIGGKFTQGLTELKIGDQMFVSGPYGKFVFDETKHRDLVMIAGGIGITPFLSAMNYVADKKLANNLSLIYSNKTFDSTLFYKEIAKLTKENDNLKSLFCITGEQCVTKKENIVNGRLNESMLSEFTGHTAGKTFFICGPLNFMAAVKDNLSRIGVEDSQIEMEAFSMIPDMGIWAVTKNLAYALGFSGLLALLPLSLIFKAQAAPGTDGKGSIFSATSPYNTSYLDKLGWKVYNRLLAIRNANQDIAITADVALDVNAQENFTNIIAEATSTDTNIIADASTMVSTDETAPDSTTVDAKVNAKTELTAKTIAKAQARTMAKTVAPKTVATPAPATKVSVSENKPAATQPVTSNQNNPSAATPAPVTSASSASSPAPTTPAQSGAVNQNTPTSAPAPVTGASSAAASPTPTAPATPQSTPVSSSPAPAPVTSSSIPATTTPAPTTPASIPSSSSTGTTIGSTPASVTPAPTPTTSSSVPATSAGSGSTTTTTPAPATTPVAPTIINTSTGQTTSPVTTRTRRTGGDD